MKHVSPDLIERLTGDALTLCLCWRLIRRDGYQLNLTDHDRPLRMSDVLFEPGAAIGVDQFSQGLDLKPGRAGIGGAFSSEAILEADLKQGLWDGCRVQVYRADWQRPDLGWIHFWSGYLSEVRFQPSGKFEADLVSLKADLERPIGRVIQRQCDAQLGDERCGIAAAGRQCDKRFNTCRDVFNNSENYRGFPHLPGNDFILAGPAASGNDGTKR